jgi:DedD protein
MNSLLDESEEDDLDHRRSHHGSRDREITLGTTLILGIFFGLAVLCAVFFGFGYSLGSKHNPAAPAAPVEASASGNFSGFKPAPGSPVGSTPKQASTETVAVPYNSAAAAKPAAPAPAKSPITPEPVGPTSGRSVVKTTPVATTTAPAPAVTSASSSATAAGAASIVQVAAVSHQEDADLIASTLKRRGYAVTIRPEAQDKLLHVQIGPFATKKDAEAMRQRLLADGFNAYVK